MSMLKKLKGSKLSLAQTYNWFSSLIFRSTSRIHWYSYRIRCATNAWRTCSAESRDDRGNPDASVLEMLTDAAQSHTDDVLWD